jgi:hypothetical protein
MKVLANSFKRGIFLRFVAETPYRLARALVYWWCYSFVYRLQENVNWHPGYRNCSARCIHANPPPTRNLQTRWHLVATSLRVKIILTPLGSVRRGMGIFLFTTASRTALEPTQTPIQWVPGALTLGVKRPGREADHSPASSAEVKNAWSNISAPPLRLHGVIPS